VLLGLDEDGLQRRITLKPLSRAEVTRLAHDVLRGEPGRRSTFVLEPLVSWLMERSSGHPLYVIGLLRAFLKQGGDPAAPSLERVPENLQQRINLEIQALDPTARDVLEALAVVEQRIDVATLACEITHPVVSDAVYQQIGGTRRRALHRTVGRALPRASRLGSAARHYARAAEPGNDEAVEALCEAMLQAESRGLYQEALAVLAALLDVLPADDSRWLRILHAMVWQSEWVMSHLAENDSGTAIVAMERIERHLPRQDAPARAAVTFHLASFLSFGAGRMAEAERACQNAVSDFELAGDVEGALLARNELAWNRACGATLAEGAALADEVLDDALVGGHSRAAVHAAGTQAYVLGAMGAFDDSARRYDQAIELAGVCGLSYRVAWAMSNRAPMLALAGRPREAFASLEAAPAADRLAADAHLYENLAFCHWLAGRLHDAAGAVERAAVRRPMRGSLRRGLAPGRGVVPVGTARQPGPPRRRCSRPRRAERARARRCGAGGCRAHRPRNRRAALHRPPHGRHPPRQRLRQAGRQLQA
jgi:tetratricopeptide (TPR) repeat protein